jgi:glycosyltransferase involved in cell wall biosynthesis
MRTSFLLCGHNSRPDLIRRVLEACQKQEELGAEDEILMIDSGSASPLQIPEGLERRVRLVREEAPGLARARVRGIRESRGEILVFVDDDTVLAPNYLKEARRILRERPYLGAIGGQLLPEYEGPLPLPEMYYRERLAIREFKGEHWSNRWDDFATSPIGGGMVVRREVAGEWAQRCEETPWRMEMGRKGNALSGGEDFDLLHTACEMGLGKGIFASLQLTHVFPAHRLTEDFLVRITEGNARSGLLLKGLLEPDVFLPRLTWPARLRLFMESLRKSQLNRRLLWAETMGAEQGAQEGRLRRIKNQST